MIEFKHETWHRHGRTAAMWAEVDRLAADGHEVHVHTREGLIRVTHGVEQHSQDGLDRIVNLLAGSCKWLVVWRDKSESAWPTRQAARGRMQGLKERKQGRVVVMGNPRREHWPYGEEANVQHVDKCPGSYSWDDIEVTCDLEVIKPRKPLTVGELSDGAQFNVSLEELRRSNQDFTAGPYTRRSRKDREVDLNGKQIKICKARDRDGSSCEFWADTKVESLEVRPVPVKTLAVIGAVRDYQPSLRKWAKEDQDRATFIGYDCGRLRFHAQLSEYVEITPPHRRLPAHKATALKAEALGLKRVWLGALEAYRG